MSLFGQGLIPIKNADIVQTQETTLENIAILSVLAIDPPGKVQQQLVEYQSKESEVAVPTLLAIDFKNPPRDRATVAMREALKAIASLEMRRRLEGLLNELKAPPSGEALGELRAVAVLERIGTPTRQLQACSLRETPVTAYVLTRSPRDFRFRFLGSPSGTLCPESGQTRSKSGFLRAEN